MAEGGQITVGAVAVEIVPSAKNFAASLAAQILPQTAAIAAKLGDQFGDKIEKKTEEGIKKGLSGSDSKAAAAGEKAANNFGGAFGRQAKSALRAAEAALPDINIDGDPTKFEEALIAAREKAATMSDLDIGINLSGEDFLQDVAKLRAELAELQRNAEITIQTRVDTAEAVAALTAFENRILDANTSSGAFARTLNGALRTALADLPDPTLDMKVTGTQAARAELASIRGELLALRDKRIGIDISAADALKEVAAVGAALEALAAQTKDPRLSLDIQKALTGLATFSAAAEATRKRTEEPMELKLREGAFIADLRSALAAGASKVIEIPVGADVSPAEKELALIGKQMDRLSTKQLSPKFNDADLLAAAERVQKRLEKLTDSAKFGEAISYQAREALKGVKAFTDGVSGANFAPKIDFSQAEVNAGLAAKKVQQAFTGAFTGLPDPIITARDNAPEVQRHYEPVYRLLQDMSGTTIGLDTPTPAAVKNLRDASDALKDIRGLGKISPELDASLPAFHKAVDDAEHELGTLLGHHPPVEISADAKPAKRELGSLKSEILSVAEAMQKALGDRFSADLLGDLPASLKRETADMVKDLAGLNAEKIGDLGAPQALLQIRQTSDALKDLASLPGLNPELANNFRVAGKASDDLLKKVNALHGRDITPELRAQELQANAGSMVRDLAAQFGRLENVFPKIRFDADTTSYTKELDAIRDQARDLKLTVGITIPVADAIARARILRRELKAIFDDPIKQSVRAEAGAGLRETEAILKSLGVEAQAASKGLFSMFDKMSPAAKLANLAAVAFIGALTVGIPIAAAGIIGLTGLFLTLGTAIGVAAIGAGVFMLAFSKVTAAIKAREAAQKAAASNAAQDAQTELANQIAQTNATDAIAAARKNLDKVTTTAARNARDSALAVTAAEKNLTQAQTRETAARKKLSDAYKAAKADLAKLTAEIKANQVAQQAAIVSITQAREKYNAILADPTASESDIEAARAAYNTQESGLKTLQAAQQANAVEKAKYDKDGLNGNDQVIAAQAALKSAVDSVADSQLAVTAASTRAREQQVDDANSINDAETALSKARTDRFNLLEQQRLAAAATAATRAEVSKDYDTAPPAVKEFTDFYEKNIKPAFTQFQTSAASSGILTSIENFFTKIQPLLPSINTLITTVGASVGRFIDDLAGVASGPDGEKFIAFLKTEVPKGFDLFGKAAKVAGPFIMNLIEKLAPIADRLGPILIDMLSKLAGKFAAFADKKNGGLSDLIDKMVSYAPMVLSFLGDLFSALGTIVEALAPVGAGAAWIADIIFKLITLLGPGGLQAVGGLILTIVTIRKVVKGFSDLKDMVLGARTAMAAIRDSRELGKIASGARTAGGAIADLTGKVVSGTAAVAKNTAAWVANTAKTIASGIRAAAAAVAELTLKLIASTAQVARNAAAWLINTARLVATQVAMLAVRAATALWAAAQWILDAALNANPITLIVLAIIAAIALISFGIYELYKHWDQVWGWIKKIVSEAWKHITDAFSAGADWISGKWNSFTGWVSDKWHSFTSGISDLWHSMWDGVKEGARTALDWIQGKFKSGVELIGKAWSLLKGYLAFPIHGFFTIVNSGLIHGLNALLSHFPGKLHIDDVPEPGFIKDAVAGAAKTLGFNRGGVVPGYEPGRDTVPAVLSKGEAVLVPQVTRQIGPAQIEEWNRRGLAGMTIQHFATGTGFVTLKPHVTVAAHAAEPTVVVAKVAQPEPEKPTGLAGRLLSTFTHALEAPVQKFLGAYGDTPLVQGLARMPELFVGKIGSWVTDQIKALGEKVVNAGKSVLGWLGLIDNDAKDTKKPGARDHNAGVKAGPQAAADYAQSRLPKFGWDGGQMGSLASLWAGESSWRWNATNPDSGAYGIPQALPATKMADAGKDWRTNAFTQINWGLAYIAATYGDPASALSAWQAREPHWYDQGGYLPPGLTLAMNGTGKPEHVFTDDQLRAMREQRNSQVGVVVRVEDGAVPGLVSAEVDRSFGRLADASIYGGI